LQVAAFGDSIMWGQGNNRPDRFSMRFTTGLKARVGKQGVLVWDASRSGAKVRELPGEREQFADVYPSLFTTVPARTAFLNGTDDTPASGLYGEVPSTFPTVLGQVKMIPPAKARQINVALVDGGINDISPEDVINPLIATGHYIERYDGAIRRIVEDNVTALLQAVRAKCPNAVILYFGFFPGLCYSSDADKLRDLFKHEYNDDFKWWFNRYVYELIDVNKMINEAIVRALWFNGRWQYWTRQTVNKMAADDTRRGPGVVFVPSGFGAGEAGFNPTSCLWDDFTFPTQDEAVETRVKRIPRHAQLQQLAHFYLSCISPIGVSVPALLQEAQALDALIDGPLTLKRNLQDFVARVDGARARVVESLADEIHRIQHGMIASLAHPNHRGEVRYATQALTRYADHLDTMDKVREEIMAGPSPAAGGPQTLDGLLKRCNLRTARPLAADVTHLNIDSLAVIVKTAPNSARNMGLPAFLLLAGPSLLRRYLLTFSNYVDVFDAIVHGSDPIGKPYPYLEPGETNRLTVVADDDLKLSDITSAAIVLGEDPWPDAPDKVRRRYGRTWSPDTVTLEVNGVRVRTAELFGTKIGPRGHVDLGWPAPTPAFQPPKQLEVPKIKRVPKLDAFATTPNMPGNPPPAT
jgi:hypothetical protein